MIDLSIVIVSFNTRDMLKDCLQSLEAVRCESVEVFVVDNASGDGSPEMVKELFPWVTLIENSQNLGFAPANNQAILKSSGRYVMLLNSDTVMLRETPDSIIAFMDEESSAGIVGCKLLNTDGTLQPSTTSFPNVIKDSVGLLLKGNFLKNTPRARYWLSKIGKLLGQQASRFDDHAEIKEIDYPRGACFTIRRQVIGQIGVLDEDYFFTGEELDYCYRAKQKGWKVYYYPEVAVIHHDHGASKRVMGKVLVQTRKSALIFYQKHYSKMTTILMTAGVTVALLLSIFFKFIALLFKPKDAQKIRADIEVFWFTIKIHYSKSFRNQNVLTEMNFRFN